jgi:GNAT superfamily N-acetyltransferase
MSVVAVSFERVDFDDPRARALATATVAELNSHYDGRPGSGAPPIAADFVPPHGIFLLALLAGEPIGCGGLCRFDDATAEIRRMYVAPQVRRQGISRAILAELLEIGRELGYTRARLETGYAQREAIGLYETSGFERIPCWGPYVTDERSLCFELALR